MARAFKVYAQSHQHGCGEDRHYGEFVLAFPGIEVKVPFTARHLATASVGQAIQLSRNVKKFGEQVDATFGAEDIGLRRLTELPQEEWARYMQQEAGLFISGYGYVECEVDDSLLRLLQEKVELKQTAITISDAKIDAGLVKVLLAPPAQ